MEEENPLRSPFNKEPGAQSVATVTGSDMPSQETMETLGILQSRSVMNQDADVPGKTEDQRSLSRERQHPQKQPSWPASEKEFWKKKVHFIQMLT